MSDLLLRPWAWDDDAAVVRAFAAADMLHEGGPITSRAQAREWLKPRLWEATPGMFAFAVSVDDEALGNVSVSRVERTHNTGWVAYWMAEKGRRQGLMTRAVATLAAYAFAELDVFRLELGCRLNNPASATVAARAGFLQEGVGRAKLRYGTERFDVATYSRLATDPTPAVELLPVVFPA